MLQIKNTLGGGKPEGLYAWKKSSVSYIDNITTIAGENYILGDAKSNTTVYYSNSYTIDEATGMYTLVNPQSTILEYGRNSLYSVEMVKSNYYIWGSTSSNKIYNTNASSTYSVYIHNSKGSVYLYAPTSSSNDYKYDIHSVKTEYTFLDYIVSDKETAYPDGGEKDGYYYEKVGVSFAELVSEIIGTDIKLVHKETVTLTSDNTALPHTYGKIPSKYIVFADDGFVPRSSGYSVKMVVCGIFPSNYANGVTFSESGNMFNSVSSINFYGTNETQFQIRYSNAYMYYKSNCTYTILIFE